MQRVAGVTLPGLPAVVVGSNGHIAWGFTNGYGQWFDWVARPKAATGDKPAITTYRETIAVKGGENEDIEVRESPFGPILKTDTDNDYALSWVLYRDGGVNMHAGDMMFAQNVDDAIAIAHASGIPHQNVLIADKQGNVAWTIMGRIPRSESVPRQSTRGQLTPLAALPTVWLATTHYPLVKILPTHVFGPPTTVNLDPKPVKAGMQSATVVLISARGPCKFATACVRNRRSMRKACTRFISTTNPGS